MTSCVIQRTLQHVLFQFTVQDGVGLVTAIGKDLQQSATRVTGHHGKSQQPVTSMNFILAATTLFAGCVALTSAQTPSPAAPETIRLRDWFSFGVGSNYHAWRHGFPAGKTLAMIVSGHSDVDGFFHEQLYDEARGNIDDFWTYLSYAHAECELNDDDEISLAYMYYACREANGSYAFCPKPCGADPCPLNSDCKQTLAGLFVDNYRCECHVGYAWDSVQSDCVTLTSRGTTTSGGTTTSEGNMTSGGNMTTASQPPPRTTRRSQFTTKKGSVGGHQPFSYTSSSSAATTTSQGIPQTTVSPPLTWDNFTKLYSDWRHGFPPGTTLSSVLPGVIDPDDVLDTLYHRLAQGDPGEFWKHLLAASTVGDLTSDQQLLSLAYIYYLCRETLSQNSECPDPCGDAPCAARTCMVTGAGLFRNDYQCNCAEHYHWDPQLTRCVFCAPGTAWSEIHQQCVHVAESSVLPPIDGDVPSAPSWSIWSTWSACSSECGAGTRSRRRTCQDGPCNGHRHEQEKCEGYGFWQCDGMLVVGGAGAMGLLLLVAGILIFVAAKRGQEREDDRRKLAGGDGRRTRQRSVAPRRRGAIQPKARRPTRPRGSRLDRPAQRPRAGSRRPLETREASRQWDPRDYPPDTDRLRDPRDYPSDTDRRWDPRDYPSDTDRLRDPRDYPSDTDRRWDPRDYPSDTDRRWDARDYPSDTDQRWDDRQWESGGDYPPDNDRQWGQLDYPDQTDRYRSYSVYPQTEQPYDPYRRQTNYYYNL